MLQRGLIKKVPISEDSEFSILGIGQDRQLRNRRNVRFSS